MVSLASAQGNHRLAPVGGRTTLVGGTGLVYANDSAAAFLNPATVVRIESGRLAFAVSFYQLTLAKAPRWYQPGAIDRATFGDVPSEGASTHNTDIDGLPGNLCLYLPIADIKVFAREASEELRARRARLGLCLANVERGSYTFNEESYAQAGPFGVSRQASSVRQTFSRFVIGPTYSMYIDNALAVGASLHFNRTSVRRSIGNTSTLYGSGAAISSVLSNAARGDAHAVSATIGATYRIGSRQTVAAVIEVPSVHLFGSGGMSNFSHFDGPGGSGTSSVAASGSFATQTPWRFALGTGIAGAWGSAELNVSFHTPVGEAYRADLEGRSYEARGPSSADRSASLALSARSRGAVNIGIGGEYFFSPGLSVLAGLGTDISAVPRGALGRDAFTYFSADTHRAFTSFGVGSHGTGGDLLLGGELAYGWGEQLATNAYVLPPRVEATRLTQIQVMFVLAGSTSLRNITRAVQDVGHAIEPKGTKKPAPPTR